MPQVHWQYYFARKFSLQRFEVVTCVFVSDFYWKHFRVRLKNILVKPETGGNHAIYLDAREYEQMVKNIFNVVCRNLKHFLYYKRMIKRVQNEWVCAAKKVALRTRASLSNKQLGKLYDIFIHHHLEHFKKPIWIPFPIEPMLSEKAQDALAHVLQRTNRPQEYENLFQTVFTPEEKNAITRCEEEILSLALKIKNKKLAKVSQNKALSRIHKKYGFIPCYDVIDKPWDYDHFKNELKNVLKKSRGEIALTLRDLRSKFKKRKINFRQFINATKMTTRERELLIMGHELVFIKDERDDYRRMGSCLGRKLFAELGRRLSLELKEASYLSIHETKEWLHNGIMPPPIHEIKKRVHGYLILRKHGVNEYIGNAKEMNPSLLKELQLLNKWDGDLQIKGISSSNGKASGLAVIIRTKHDLHKIRPGSIMVAVTTNPDFVPAMKLCKAIVTDEGGVTAHASIVSRELGIPCIVGTKTATRILKDGYKIEVDATSGIVRRL